MPDGYNAWGARAQLRQDNLEKMAALYQEAARGGPGISAAAHRVGLYNAAQMDLATIERKGLAPVRAMLDEIAALRDKTALAAYLGARLRVDVDPVNFGAFASENPFGLWVGPGLKNPARHLPYLLQGGLSLGGPETYLASDAEQQAVIAQLRRYIGELLGAAT
ncbi:M13 family metallopeptidase [Massilia sp. H-1]|nr:M13 family metallopeptidase [Massilia sp. H-1]